MSTETLIFWIIMFLAVLVYGFLMYLIGFDTGTRRGRRR